MSTNSSKKRRDTDYKHKSSSSSSSSSLLRNGAHFQITKQMHRNSIQKATTSPDSNNSIDSTLLSQQQRRRSSVRTSTTTTKNVHKVTNMALLILSVSVSMTLFIALLKIFDLEIPDHNATTSTTTTTMDLVHSNNFLPPFLPSSQSQPLLLQSHSKRDDTTAQTSTVSSLEMQHPKDELPLDANQQPFKLLLHSPSLWEGRENLYRLLSDAKVVENITQSEIDQLPLDRHIQELYGDSPIFMAASTTTHRKNNDNHCQTFRNTIPFARRRLAVAGLFNSGTNLLETMLRNIQMIRPSLWQVPWGKHRLASVRDNHTAPDFQYYNKTEILPVVIVRDPYMWFQSMCVHPYSVRWRHGNYHCPNFVPNEQDRSHYPRIPDDHVNVAVRYEKYSIANFTSLAELWVEWHREYIQAESPVLMIRFEDLVFKPQLVLQQIAECAGGKVKTPIRYQVNTAKSHGSGTNFVKAIVKTANKMARSQNMTQQDLEYAQRHLDRDMMELFRYRHPSEIVQSNR